MKKIWNLLANHWGTMVIAFGIVSAVFSTIGFALYTVHVEPRIDSYITKVSRKMISDSSVVIAETLKEDKAGGYRGQVESYTGIPKHNVALSYAKIYKEEDSLKQIVDSMSRLVAYQQGLNMFFISQVTTKNRYNGVDLYVTSSMDDYYLDEYGYFWHAVYIMQDDKYYYFPSYANGKRLLCK